MSPLQKSLRRDLFQLVGLGLLIVFVFCGSDWLPSPSFIEWSQRLPDGHLHKVMTWTADHLCIFSNAGVALVRQFRHNVQGHGVFLLEQVEKRALWYYFPLAVSIKYPLPLLFLPVLLTALCGRALRNWVNWLALALLFFSLVCRVQTGIRLVLPLMALSTIGLAASLIEAHRQLHNKKWRCVIPSSGSLTAVWLGWGALSVWPHGLCYTNELWGGTANGYCCLSDSNYDWGQGLKDLARWQQVNEVRDLDVLYYGTDTTLWRLPMRPLVVGGLQLGEDDLPLLVKGRTFAVGTSIVYGSVSETFDDLKALARALRRLQPIDRTATFLIYRLPASQELATANNPP
jgi:hypothetical protein